MRRSSRWRNGRRSDSTATALQTVTRPTRVAAAHGPDQSLAQGTLVEADVLVRLAGLHLLRLTGTVVLTPVVPETEPVIVPGSGVVPAARARTLAARRELPEGNLADARALLRQAAAALKKFDGTSPIAD